MKKYIIGFLLVCSMAGCSTHDYQNHHKNYDHEIKQGLKN